MITFVSLDLMFLLTRVIDVSMKMKIQTLLKIKEWREKYGSEASEIEKQLKPLLNQLEKRESLKNVNIVDLKDTKIIREYQGKTYIVFKTDDGFVFNEKKYRSLSAIANEITRTHCNGKKFFGVS